MYNKAIAAFISNAAILGAAVGVNINIGPELVAAIATVVNAIIVYAVPNQA